MKINHLLIFIISTKAYDTQSFTQISSVQELSKLVKADTNAYSNINLISTINKWFQLIHILSCV
jgi:hypothetical protein